MDQTKSEIVSNGIRHVVHRFRCPDLEREGARRVLLLHGFLDAGSTWDLVAGPLARAGYDVHAPDLRGFGASGRVPLGGYYHFADYIADVDGLVNAITANSPGWLAVVGHSMGGTIASLWAGIRPERVAKLAILEGLGPPVEGADQGVHRMRQWLRDLDRIERSPRPMESIEQATKKLAATHPKIDLALLRTRAERLVTEDASGRIVWAHDPLHRTHSPTPFQADVFMTFLRSITCPTLYANAGESGWRTPDEAERVACLRDARTVTLEGAGHMMHWSAPVELAEALLSFFAAD